ncbi:unnamed protein product [Rhodiola kirilowii]
MTERNVVPWTAIIECYSRWSDVDSGFVMFNPMRAEGVAPSAVTLLGPSLLLVAAFLLVCMAYEVASDGSDHRYKAGDPSRFMPTRSARFIIQLKHIDILTSILFPSPYN